MTLLKVIYLLLLHLAVVSEAVNPDGRYIIIESQDGLANRLRLLAGYMYVQRRHHNVSHILMIWDLNEACPGHFLELFHPVHRVSFISREDLPVFAKQAVVIHPPSYQNFLEVLRHHNLWSPQDNPAVWHQARRDMYSHFRALPHINQQVAHFVREHSVCSIAAMHVRHTDLDKSRDTGRTDLDELRRVVDKGFDDWMLETLPPDMPVFLMTDSVDTQRRYMRKFGERIVVFELMDGSNGYQDLSDGWGRRLRSPQLLTRSGSVNSTGRRLLVPPSQHSSVQVHHRQTTLRRSLIDVLIAAHSLVFRGTDSSTFSELVHLFNITSARMDVPCSAAEAASR